MKLNLNHIIHFSTIDYPEKVACVVFLNECPFRCDYCHNKQTWTGINMVDIDKVKTEIQSCTPFVSSIVFSGGEPTKQIDSLAELCKFSKELGLLVGIETNGFYPENLIRLKGYVDKVFVDIKAPINNPEAYYRKTDNIFAARNIQQTLKLDLPIEIRIVDTGDIKEIIDSIGTAFKIHILPLTKTKKTYTKQV